MSQEGEKVILNIYDLSQGLARQLSGSLLGKVIDGIWHTGVAVYGFEYYFGGGIQRTPIGQTPYGKPYEIVELGSTQLPKEVFEDYLNEIRPRYTEATYNVLRHNCNNFSEEIAQFLVGSSIPQYILDLPDEVLNSPSGAMLLPMIKQLENSLRHNQAPAMPQPYGSSTVPDFSDIEVPSTGVSINRTTSTAPSSAARRVPSLATNSSIQSPFVSPEMERVSAAPGKDGESKKVEGSQKKSMADGTQAQMNALGDARAKVQDEITKEFMVLMASGTLRASEAAALAARRVMARHGITTN